MSDRTDGGGDDRASENPIRHLSRKDEYLMMNDIWSIIPKAGGINTSRWADPDDHKLAMAELAAQKAKAIDPPLVTLARKLEAYQKAHPEYFGKTGERTSEHNSDSTMASPPTKPMTSVPVNCLAASDSPTPSTESLKTPALVFLAQSFSSRNDNMKSLDLSTGLKKSRWANQAEDDGNATSTTPTVALTDYSTAAGNQITKSNGNSYPHIRQQAENGTDRVLPHLQTRQVRHQTEPSKGSKRSLESENIGTTKPGDVPVHLRSRTATTASENFSDLPFYGPVSATTQIVKAVYIPPHLRKKASIMITAAAETTYLSAQRDSNEQLKSTPLSSVSDYVLPHLRKKPFARNVTITSAKITNPPDQEGQHERYNAIVSLRGSDDIRPHLRGKPAIQVTSPVKITGIKLDSPDVVAEKWSPRPPSTSSSKTCAQASAPVSTTIENNLVSVSNNNARPPSQSQKKTILAESMEDFQGISTGNSFDPRKYGCPKAFVHNQMTLSSDHANFNSDPKLTQFETHSKGETSTPHKPKYVVGKMLEIKKCPDLIQPLLIGTLIMHEISSLAKPDDDVDVALSAQGTFPSNDGAATPQSVVTLEEHVSDAGVNSQWVDNGSAGDTAVPDCRAEIAHEAIGLLDWDGSWAPAPASWENERNGFSNEFIPTFINIWNRGNGEFKPVDTSAERFVSGEGPVNPLHGNLMETPPTPVTFPDLKSSLDEIKQRNQTSETDCKIMVRKLVRDERRRTRWKIAAQNQIDTSFEMIYDNPNTPLIPVYLRPARANDIPSITAIYNHYVENSIVTEDQIPVSEEDMLQFFKALRAEFLPFIVAIKGNAPDLGQNISNEVVVGYSCLVGEFGINTTATRGLRRYTSKIHFFVEPNHLRNGIGRALLDRLLATSTSTHNAKEGYDWIVTEQEKLLYNNIGYTGGERRYHQLMLELPIEVKDDRFYEWFKEWLRQRFWFKQVALLDSVARTKVGGTNTRWLNLAIFQMEASLPGCYDTNA